VNYRLLIRPDALDDIEVSAKWYNDQEAGLGEILPAQFLKLSTVYQPIR